MSNTGKKHELRVAAIAMAAANSNGRAVVGRLSGGCRDSFSELLPNALCSPVALALWAYSCGFPRANPHRPLLDKPRALDIHWIRASSFG
jgi:hypothetical protein